MLQVAANGPHKERIALLDTMSEYDLIHNGTQVWLYDSRENGVETRDAPDKRGRRCEAAVQGRTSSRRLRSPRSAAQQLLAALSPSTYTRWTAPSRSPGAPRTRWCSRRSRAVR